MTWTRVLIAKFNALLTRRLDERDLDDEIKEHLRLLCERYVRQGLTEKDAFYAARRQFGGVAKVKRDLHEGRSFSQMETLLQDVLYALRSLRNAPIFTLTAVALS